MLNSLLSDLAELPQVQLLTTRDSRLPPLPVPIDVVEAGGNDIWQCWQDCLIQADALWPIAPESGGMLERMSRLAEPYGKRLLGSQPQTVGLAASKQATAAALATQGLAAVPTFLPSELPPDLRGPWVVKPDDGAGCEDTRWFADVAEMRAWLATGRRLQTHVVQPFMAGEAASLSMLCLDGQARLLSCNRQLMELRHGEFSYHGSVVNGQAQHWDSLDRVAQAVAAAMPGLAGYVGVDVMLNDTAVTVMEVNPRLTTSYAGLHRAIGCNPARLVLDLLYNGGFQSFPDLARNVVNITLDE